MDIEKIKQAVEDLATPIDFDGLIAAGILEKKGAWYKVNKLSDLPESAQVKIVAVQQSSKGIFIKFCSPGKKLSKLLKT